MELVVTEDLRKLLQQAAKAQGVPKEVRAEAEAHKDNKTVPWKTLKAVRDALRTSQGGSSSSGGPYLHQLCQGSSLVVEGPTPKPPNPELEARRQMLRAQLENMQYESMVSDITAKEREAEAQRGMFPSYRSQLSFAAHVLVTMFTFFALGYWGGKQYLELDELWAGLLGALGISFGLLLETSLLILRSNMPQSMEDKYPHLFDPKIWNKKKKGKDDKPIEVLRPQGMAVAEASGAAAGDAGAGSKESKKTK